MKNILFIPHIKVINANALSSPYTIGFPAMTAWLGAVHALQRRLHSKKYGQSYRQLRLISMAVICHHFDLRTYRGEGDYVNSIIGTSNPLIPKAKKGKPEGNAVRSSFIEEARCHMQISLIVEMENYDTKGINGKGIDEQRLAQDVDHEILAGMKIAGGDILSSQACQICLIDSQIAHKQLMRQLTPGHCLIERRDLMIQEMKNGSDGIDALLNYLKVSHSCQINENNQVNWVTQRKEKGWLIPVATGYQGISELAITENQRDLETPHQFAESLVTVGEFVMPYRIENLDQMLWHYQTDLTNQLYLCQQNQTFSQVV